MRNETARREIESLDYYLQNHTNDYSEESHTAMMMAVDALSSKWIPVSERLPDIHNYCMKYLVTDCHRHIHTSLFTESGGKSWWSYEDVIAWMPLPEPYKAESEE